MFDKKSTNQKLDIKAIDGLENINDQAAEAYMGGDFNVWRFDKNNNPIKVTKVKTEPYGGAEVYGLPVKPGEIIGVFSTNSDGDTFVVNQYAVDDAPLKQDILKFNSTKYNPKGFLRVGDGTYRDVATIYVGQRGADYGYEPTV